MIPLYTKLQIKLKQKQEWEQQSVKQKNCLQQTDYS